MEENGNMGFQSIVEGENSWKGNVSKSLSLDTLV
jgi:hypothetical protein